MINEYTQPNPRKPENDERSEDSRQDHVDYEFPFFVREFQREPHELPTYPELAVSSLLNRTCGGLRSVVVHDWGCLWAESRRVGNSFPPLKG